MVKRWLAVADRASHLGSIVGGAREAQSGKWTHQHKAPSAAKERREPCPRLLRVIWRPKHERQEMIDLSMDGVVLPQYSQA